jgi:SAM-dependent methyltransferase
MDQRYWDELYGEHERIWSGEPNEALVAEVADLPPGRALDVGCGEGGDAHWLARRGWRVTAVDISAVALERAAATAADGIEWRHVDLLTVRPEPNAYDLVSAHYFPIPHEPDHDAVRGLLAAVAPGGTLLFVGHDLTHVPAEYHGPDPGNFYHPAEIAALLDDTWTVAVHDTRIRARAEHHPKDIVLRARKSAAGR